MLLKAPACPGGAGAWRGFFVDFIHAASSWPITLTGLTWWIGESRPKRG
jgi:hypothetical protein